MRFFVLGLLVIITGCSYPRYELQKLDARDRMQDFIRPEEIPPHSYPSPQRGEGKVRGIILDMLHYTQQLKQTRDSQDYWQYPKETIQKGGDCEDKTFLLLSMLIQGGINGAQGVKGRYLGQGHMWVEHDGYILDPSRRNTGLIPIEKSTGYVPHFKFDQGNIYFCNTGKEKK